MQSITTLRQKIALIVSGIIVALLIFKMCLAIGGWVYLWKIEYRNRISSARHKGGYKIMFIGESTTADGAYDSYPRHLGRILREKVPDRDFIIINRGVPGADTTYLVGQLVDDLKQYQPDMVVVMMGLNDRPDTAVNGKGSKKIEGFIKNLMPYKFTKFVLAKMREHKKLRDIYLERARYNWGKKNFYRAELLYKRAIELDLHAASVYLELGECYQDFWRYPEAEKMFRAAMALDPGDYNAYLRLARYYQELHNDTQAEQFYQKVAEFNPDNYEIYLEIAQHYAQRQDYARAEDMYLRAIDHNPKAGGAYLELGQYYRSRQDYTRATEEFLRLETLDPAEAEGYINLGLCYEAQGKFAEATEAFKKAINIVPHHYDAFIGFGRYLRKRDNNALAEKMFREAITIEPENEAAYIELGWVYGAQGRYRDAEAMFTKAIGLYPYSELSNEDLENCYRDREGGYFKKKIREMVNKISSGRNIYLKKTTHNYRRLKKIVDGCGIQLVCVQYPRLRLQPLKEIFASTKGIIFVDNEEVFNQAIWQGTYEDYFYDNFAGLFGHCTPKGNYLLASNIAEVIIKEYFYE